MNEAKKIADCGLRIADLEAAPIRNAQFAIRNTLQQYLVGGVNSPVRAFKQVGGQPLWLSRSRGAEVWDANGRRYTDFIMGWGAIILGHNPPPVVRALRSRISKGLLLGLTHEMEAELARLIAQAVPSVEQVRFTASGSEACLTAVKLARAHTGRAKILLFDGGYHGHGESVMAGRSAGLPAALETAVVTVPFNDPAAFDEALRQHGAELACVLIEPVAANMGVIPPEPGWLAHLRERTAKAGIVLIFDEVVTGFRMGLGGAQGLFGIEADLTAFGKIIGGGLPVGAVGGPRRLMQRLAPEGDVYHGGTFAGHPLAMAAGVATVQQLRANPPYERIEHLAAEAAEGLTALGQDIGVALQVNRAGSMFTVFFTATAVRSKSDAKASHKERFAHWANELRRAGVLVPPSPFEALFVGAAHTRRHIEQLLDASKKALQSMDR
ncbi:MAG: glutamate-1-semialdehyde 2,1-aminomutase [Candidatus Omnitrophica bacterium]|nr:glutamate-1-semialdehyde 2,1-aminomutase [Candidatus Omnitrophota bacterium]